MMRLQKKVRFMLLALAVLIMGTSCGSKNSVLKIVNQRPEIYWAAPSLIMQEKGLLDKYLPQGVTVEWSYIDKQADMRDAVVSGQADIGVLPISQIISARSNGLPIIPLSGNYSISLGLYSCREDLTSVEDITANDKIGVAAIGNLSHTMLRVHCEEAYGDAKKYDANMAVMSYADMWAAIDTSDELSCVLMVYADTLRADGHEKMELILDLTPYLSQYAAGTASLTTEKFYKENPELVAAYDKALLDALSFIAENPTEAAALLSKYWEYEPAVIEEELRKTPFNYEMPEAGYDKLAEFLYAVGVIENAPGKFADMPNYDDIPKERE